MRNKRVGQQGQRVLRINAAALDGAIECDGALADDDRPGRGAVEAAALASDRGVARYGRLIDDCLPTRNGQAAPGTRSVLP